MAKVKEVSSEAEYQRLLASNAGVVVDFTASWWSVLVGRERGQRRALHPAFLSTLARLGDGNRQRPGDRQCAILLSHTSYSRTRSCISHSLTLSHSHTMIATVAPAR